MYDKFGFSPLMQAAQNGHVEYVYRLLFNRTLVTHADCEYSDYRSTSVILSVCPHDETKTAETKITQLGTQIVHRDTSPTGEF